MIEWVSKWMHKQILNPKKPLYIAVAIRGRRSAKAEPNQSTSAAVWWFSSPPDKIWILTVRCESDLGMIGLASARSGKLLLCWIFWWRRKTRLLIKYKSEWNSSDSLFCSLKIWYNAFLFPFFEIGNTSIKGPQMYAEIIGPHALI